MDRWDSPLSEDAARQLAEHFQMLGVVEEVARTKARALKGGAKTGPPTAAVAAGSAAAAEPYGTGRPEAAEKAEAAGNGKPIKGNKGRKQQQQQQQE